MNIDQADLTFALAVIAVISIIFQVYNSFRKPQEDTEKTTLKLEDRISSLERAVLEIKETHLRSVEKDIKDLTTAVTDLGKTVIRLSTIIDERIPKGSPNLAPLNQQGA